MKKKQKIKSTDGFGVSPRANTDSKITFMALHLENLMNWGINFKDRIITLTGDVDSCMFELLDAALSEMESQSRATVTIRIFSEGGEEGSALAIAGRMRRSKCKIITEGYGAIMSAATLIFAVGDERRISRLAWFMWHESSYGTEDRHTQTKHFIAQREIEEKQWASLMEEYSDKPASFWLEKGANQDSYFTAEQCVEELGVADEII